MARLDRAPALSNVCSVLLLLVAFFARTSAAAPDVVPKMSIERVVFQLVEGDIEFAFFHAVAPKTSAHIFELVSEGLYTSNDVFRVHKNFVAQVSAVTSRTLPFMSVAQRDLANQHVPLEVQDGVRHYEGAVSMGRNDDPNSGTSSFSMLLGAAHHLDMKYTLFGKSGYLSPGAKVRNTFHVIAADDSRQRCSGTGQECAGAEHSTQGTQPEHPCSLEAGKCICAIPQRRP
eukprot:gene31663-6861_t